MFLIIRKIYLLLYRTHVIYFVVWGNSKMCMTFFGRLVRKDVKVEHCVDGLPRGIYIVGKKKILVDR